MANALALRMAPEKIAAMEHVISQCSLQHQDGGSQFKEMFTMAAGMRELRNLITADAMEDVMQLQNTALGFRTDKSKDSKPPQPEGYPVDVVKDCIIEASLRGLRPVGNEFNIISGRVYVTKEGFARLVREYPGLTDLRLQPQVPRMRDGGALVQFKATWNLDGQPQSLEREYPVRVNAGMGADAIIGKATRKMLAAIYGQLTGSEHALREGDVTDLEPQRTSVSTLPLPPESTQDRPEMGTGPDAEIADACRTALSVAGDDFTVDEITDRFYARAKDEPTRTAIDVLIRERKAQLAALQGKPPKQRELVK